MDQNIRSEHLSAGEPASTASLDFDENTTPVSNYSTVPDNTYKIDSLEVHSEQQGAQIALPNTARSIFRSFSKRRAVIVSTIIAVLVTLSTGATALWLGKNAPKTNDASRLNVPVQGIELQGQSTSNLPAELQGAAESLVVSGDVITRGNLKFSNNSFVTIIQPSNQTADQTFTLPNASGTLCLDSNNCAFAQQADIDLLNGQLNALATQLGQIVVPQVPPSATINSQTGSVVLQGTTNQISVTTNNGTITDEEFQVLKQRAIGL